MWRTTYTVYPHAVSRDHVRLGYTRSRHAGSAGPRSRAALGLPHEDRSSDLEVSTLSESPLQSVRISPRPSQRLLALALAMTLLTIIACTVFILAVWGSTFGASSAPVTTASAPGEQPLVVGIGRTPCGPGEWLAYATVFAQLQADLGRPVVLRYGVDRSNVQAVFETSAVDIAFVPVTSYLDLEGAGLATLVAAPIVDGETRDTAVLVVKADSPYERLEDLRGARVALAEGSLSSQGFVYWLASETGEDPEEFFGAIDLAPSQDANLERVVRGEAEATSVRLSALALWTDGTFRVIESSSEFGMPPVVARTGLEAETIERIRESLTSPATARAIPADSVLDGFVPAESAEYEFSRVLKAILVAARASDAGASP